METNPLNLSKPSDRPDNFDPHPLKLPPEIFTNILRYLKGPSKASLTMVSKACHHITIEEEKRRLTRKLNKLFKKIFKEASDEKERILLEVIQSKDPFIDCKSFREIALKLDELNDNLTRNLKENHLWIMQNFFDAEKYFLTVAQAVKIKDAQELIKEINSSPLKVIQSSLKTITWLCNINKSDEAADLLDRIFHEKSLASEKLPFLDDLWEGILYVVFCILINEENFQYNPKVLSLIPKIKNSSLLSRINDRLTMNHVLKSWSADLKLETTDDSLTDPSCYLPWESLLKILFKMAPDANPKIPSNVNLDSIPSIIQKTKEFNSVVISLIECLEKKDSINYEDSITALELIMMIGQNPLLDSNNDEEIKLNLLKLKNLIFNNEEIKKINKEDLEPLANFFKKETIFFEEVEQLDSRNFLQKGEAEAKAIILKLCADQQFERASELAASLTKSTDISKASFGNLLLREVAKEATSIGNMEAANRAASLILDPSLIIRIGQTEIPLWEKDFKEKQSDRDREKYNIKKAKRLEKEMQVAERISYLSEKGLFKEALSLIINIQDSAEREIFLQKLLVLLLSHDELDLAKNGVPHMKSGIKRDGFLLKLIEKLSSLKKFEDAITLIELFSSEAKKNHARKIIQEHQFPHSSMSS